MGRECTGRCLGTWSLFFLRRRFFDRLRVLGVRVDLADLAADYQKQKRPSAWLVDRVGFLVVTY